MDRIKNLFATPKRTVVTLLCMAAVLLIIVFAGGMGIHVWARMNAISSAEAEKIAVAYAGIDESLIQNRRTEFEFDNGQFIYEIKLTAEGAQYDCQIRAKDGSVLSQKTKKRESQTSGGYAVSADEAKSKALQDAQLTVDSVTFTKEEFDYDDGIALFKLRFHTADTDYRYEINMETGGIESKKMERYFPQGQETNTVPSGEPGGGMYSQSEEGNAYIGMERAKEIAVAHAGISASEAMFSKVKTDREHGRSVYEVEFYAQGMEYEYEIDALNGTVLKFDKEYDND